MDSHSWSNRKSGGVIITQDDDRSANKLSHGICYCRQENGFIPATLTKDFYVIGRAYIEPRVCNNIEDLLMQRNFIID
ncbi:MAG: hypothetical protein KJO60_13845 [Desulfofustis sp.]|nr:hypothetical protein [Desulfofustis sp.]